MDGKYLVIFYQILIMKFLEEISWDDQKQWITDDNVTDDDDVDMYHRIQMLINDIGLGFGYIIIDPKSKNYEIPPRI